jgi:hypothetical protein
MSNINKRIKELTPYVLGIRFKDTLSVVDTNLRKGGSYHLQMILVMRQ